MLKYAIDMQKVIDLINKAQKIIVIQAENPDGDSLASALALEEILTEQGKDTSLYCPVQIPTYLHYINGWDRVSDGFDLNADLAVVLDTTSKILLSKTFAQVPVAAWFEDHKTLAIDHHASFTPDIPYRAEYIIEDRSSTGEIIYHLAKEHGWKINQQAAENLFISINADTLGLTTENVSYEDYEFCAELIKLGANPAEIETRRRELSKKSPRILAYKGELLQRVSYHCDSRLALVNVPFEEIAKYSNEYNPTMLVLDEMRLVTGVDVAIGTKTYPDGKFTAKVRTNLPIADQVAGFFGGGGHAYAAGFRAYAEDKDFEKLENELIGAVDKILLSYDSEHGSIN